MTVRTADDTGADKNRCGLKGSPTQVIETFVPVHDINSEMIEEIRRRRQEAGRQTPVDAIPRGRLLNLPAALRDRMS